VCSSIELLGKNFKTHYTVKDAGGQGRGKIMPDAAVQETVVALQCGVCVLL
jgi:hypothetical protein